MFTFIFQKSLLVFVPFLVVYSIINTLFSQILKYFMFRKQPKKKRYSNINLIIVSCAQIFKSYLMQRRDFCE